MRNSFLHEDKYSRFFGGSAGEKPLDIYLTGYHYLFVSMPDKLKKYIAENTAAGKHEKITEEKIEAILSIHNVAVTPPANSLGKTTNNSVGGQKWHTPTNLELGDSVSVKYNEYSSVPLYRIHRAWINFIRDTTLGITPGDTPIYQEDYKATFLYATTRPDGKTIEFCAKFTGCFPAKSPTDVFNSDISTSDKIEIDMEYSIDSMYDNNPEVIAEITSKINESRRSGIQANSDRYKTKTSGGN